MSALSSLPLVRLSKVALLAASCFFLFLVVLNNLTDYGSNFLFVENVLGMTTTFEGNALQWRAITAPWVHHVFYAMIILWEAVAMGVIGWGSLLLIRALRADAATFQRAKRVGLAGLTLSMLQWYVAFITVGGEWFLMWQSDIWNGQDAAFRMFAMMAASAIFLNQRDEELDSAK